MTPKFRHLNTSLCIALPSAGPARKLAPPETTDSFCKLSTDDEKILTVQSNRGHIWEVVLPSRMWYREVWYQRFGVSCCFYFQGKYFRMWLFPPIIELRNVSILKSLHEDKPWRWTQQVLTKHWYLCTKLQAHTSFREPEISWILPTAVYTQSRYVAA
jgi:hypothetical protein